MSSRVDDLRLHVHAREERPERDEDDRVRRVEEEARPGGEMAPIQITTVFTVEPEDEHRRLVPLTLRS